MYKLDYECQGTEVRDYFLVDELLTLRPPQWSLQSLTMSAAKADTRKDARGTVARAPLLLSTVSLMNSGM